MFTLDRRTPLGAQSSRFLKWSRRGLRRGALGAGFFLDSGICMTSGEDTALLLTGLRVRGLGFAERTFPLFLLRNFGFGAVLQGPFLS